MPKCLVCNKLLELGITDIIYKRKEICFECLSKFEIRNERLKVGNIEVHILYKYNDFFKDLLFKYKANYDYVLRKCFLHQFYHKIKREYKKYTIIPAPSYKDEDLKRGFNHVEEIFNLSSLKMIKCFSKTENWKQSSLKKQERGRIKKIIKIDLNLLTKIKKVLIVDDVGTTFSTIKAMVDLIPKDISVKVLILASNFYKL